MPPVTEPDLEIELWQNWLADYDHLGSKAKPTGKPELVDVVNGQSRKAFKFGPWGRDTRTPAVGAPARCSSTYPTSLVGSIASIG